MFELTRRESKSSVRLSIVRSSTSTLAFRSVYSCVKSVLSTRADTTFVASRSMAVIAFSNLSAGTRMVIDETGLLVAWFDSTIHPPSLAAMSPISRSARPALSDSMFTSALRTMTRLVAWGLGSLANS